MDEPQDIGGADDLGQALARGQPADVLDVTACGVMRLSLMVMA
jgi:hypothetical protein